MTKTRWTVHVGRWRGRAPTENDRWIQMVENNGEYPPWWKSHLCLGRRIHSEHVQVTAVMSPLFKCSFHCPHHKRKVKNKKKADHSPVRWFSKSCVFIDRICCCQVERKPKWRESCLTGRKKEKSLYRHCLNAAWFLSYQLIAVNCIQLTSQV